MFKCYARIYSWNTNRFYSGHRRTNLVVTKCGFNEYKKDVAFIIKNVTCLNCFKTRGINR